MERQLNTEHQEIIDEINQRIAQSRARMQEELEATYVRSLELDEIDRQRERTEIEDSYEEIKWKDDTCTGGKNHESAHGVGRAAKLASGALIAAGTMIIGSKAADASVEKPNKIIVTAKPGDTYGTLTEKVNSPQKPADAATLNGNAKPESLKAGQKVELLSCDSGELPVHRGDTQSGLARREDLSLPQFKTKYGLTSDSLTAGTCLTPASSPVHESAETAVYTVKPGDTLTKISKETGVSVNDLAVKNNITNQDKIIAGQKLNIAAKTEAQTAAPQAPKPNAVQPKPEAPVQKMETLQRPAISANDLQKVEVISLDEAIRLARLKGPEQYGLKFSTEEVMKYLYVAGFRSDALRIMTAVTLGESNGHPFAVGDINSPNNGDMSVGICQIYYSPEKNYVSSSRDPRANLDPMTAAKNCYGFYIERNEHFSAWSAFNNGTYRRHLDEANRAFDVLTKQYGSLETLAIEVQVPVAAEALAVPPSIVETKPAAVPEVKANNLPQAEPQKVPAVATPDPAPEQPKAPEAKQPEPAATPTPDNNKQTDKPALQPMTLEAGKPKPEIDHSFIDKTTITVQKNGVVTIEVLGEPVNIEIAKQTALMIEAAQKDGIYLLLLDGHRTDEEQIALGKANGCGDDTALWPGSCRVATAKPGKSNHQDGNAIDFRYRLSADGEELKIENRNDPAFKWLQQRAAEFGFYNFPKEPWHWSRNGQ